MGYKRGFSRFPDCPKPVLKYRFLGLMTLARNMEY